jgi:hypothetical protein
MLKHCAASGNSRYGGDGGHGVKSSAESHDAVSETPKLR